MSEQEIAFLRDLQGYIDYAIRNDLPFLHVLEALRANIALKSNGLKHNMAGMANNSADDIGDPETNG